MGITDIGDGCENHKCRGWMWESQIQEMDMGLTNIGMGDSPQV